MDSNDYLIEADQAAGERGLSGASGAMPSAETPVDPFTNVREIPWSRQQNCVMPFVKRGQISFTRTDASVYDRVKTLSFRLNSITDVLGPDVLTGALNPTKADDVMEGDKPKPMWFKHWSYYYKYWHVVGSKYTLKVWLDDQATQREISIWTYHRGQQDPPLTEVGDGQPVPDYMRAHHPQAHCKQLRNVTNATQRSFYDQGVHITGYYAPGREYVKNEVVEDNQNHTWHTTTETPKLHEWVSFIFQRSDMMREVDTNTAFTMRYEFNIQYLVQWKDLKAEWKYITKSQDTSGIGDVADQQML